jgi:hypothetical protein
MSPDRRDGEVRIHNRWRQRTIRSGHNVSLQLRIEQGQRSAWWQVQIPWMAVLAGEFPGREVHDRVAAWTQLAADLRSGRVVSLCPCSCLCLLSWYPHSGLYQSMWRLAYVACRCPSALEFSNVVSPFRLKRPRSLRSLLPIDWDQPLSCRSSSFIGETTVMNIPAHPTSLGLVGIGQLLVPFLLRLACRPSGLSTRSCTLVGIPATTPPSRSPITGDHSLSSTTAGRVSLDPHSL